LASHRCAPPSKADTMQILFDEVPCTLDAGTIGEAIATARDLARDRGRFIVDITVDGCRLTEADLASNQRHAEAARIIRFTSADPVEIVAHTFEDAEDALTEADELQREAAELLQSDQHTVSMDKLGEAVSIWLSVQEAVVKGTQAIGVDLNTVHVGGASFQDMIHRLNECLKTVRRGLQDRDEVTLADTLLYEFPQIVEQWRGLLRDLRARIT
jgi:hypothetical protein